MIEPDFEETDFIGTLYIFGSIFVILAGFILLFPQTANSTFNPPPPAWKGCVSHPGHFTTTGVVTEVTTSNAGETIKLTNGQSFLDPETGDDLFSSSNYPLSVDLPSMAVGSRVTVHWDRNSPLCVFSIGSNHPTNLVTALSVQASYG